MIRIIMRASLLFIVSVAFGAGMASVAAPDSADAAVIPPAGVWYGPHIQRYGTMTWTPATIDPDSWTSGGDLVLESDLTFGSSFRVTGLGLFGESIAELGPLQWEPTFEYEINTNENGVATGYTGTFICGLPSCVLDTQEFDPDSRNYAVVSDAPENIQPWSTYAVDIWASKGTNSTSKLQHRAVAGARWNGCPAGAAWCSFENYGHHINKVREIDVYANYGAYSGGSYVTDNTFSPCPGSWGFTAGNVDKWCWSSTNGPEYPGRVTTRPKSGYAEGYAYRTVDFDVQLSGLGGADNFSVEYVVQCLTGNPCKGWLGHQVLDGSVVKHTLKTPDFTIPNDGYYYLCRYDTKHDDVIGYSDTTAVKASGDKIRVLLGNGLAGTQLRMDAMAIFGWNSYDDNTQSLGFNDIDLDPNQCNRLAHSGGV